LLVATDDVTNAVEEGRLTDLREGYRIASLTDASERAAAIAALQNGGGAPPVAAPVPVKQLEKAVKKAGRPLKSVSVKFSSGSMAKYIVSKLLDDKTFAAYKTANWDDMRVAADILGQVLKKIEKQLTPKKVDAP